jgi:hypothetical protein
VGAPHSFKPAKLVISAITGRPQPCPALRERLAALFGPIDFESPLLDFSFTDYYEREMGGGLRRCFFAFTRLISPDLLASLKLRTNSLEQELSEEGRRTVNLDPGLLSLSRFSLATTKDSAHRIPLWAGIYAELTLRFERGAFRPLPWTYPDYRSDEVLSILAKVRARLREQLAQAG